MGEAKENILQTALRLFARDGYEAVSVSQLAGELGLTKGALYRHFKSKRDIFDQILLRMEAQDAERAAQFSLPVNSLEGNEAEYRGASVAQVIAFSRAQLRYWLEDEFAAPFRRMLSLERRGRTAPARARSGGRTFRPRRPRADWRRSKK